MRKKWKAMSPTDKRRVQVLVIALLIAGYMPIFAYSSGQLRKHTHALNRRNNRMGTLTKIDTMNNDGPSERILGKRIKEVEEEIRQLAETFVAEEAGFAPVDSGEKQQELQLEISQLADRTAIDLVSVSKKKFMNRDGTPNVDPFSGRPVLNLKLNATFPQFIQFLNGLESLSYHVSVMNVQLRVAPKQGTSSRLEITLELSI